MRAIADRELALQMEDYREGLKVVAPRLAFDRIALAERTAYHFKYSSNPDIRYYVIPLTDTHYISLTFNSANNSVMESGWPELSERAQAEFLRSLALSGGDPACSG